MRLGSKSSNEFLQSINKINEDIQENFLKKVIELTKMAEIKVMLGDATVTEQKTFDPLILQNYFSKINNNLKEWDVHDVTTTNNEDLRRIFTKFNIKIGDYLLSGHLSIQFHVLLYYRPDQRVIDCQKELSEIIEKTKTKEKDVADEGDQFVLNKLKEMGYHNLDHQNLFEIFYENDELRDKLYSEAEERAGDEFQKLSKRKTELFNELDSLLIETYQTSHVLIDDARLVTGEEGCLCTFDLEHFKNNTKEGFIDPKEIPDKTKKEIINKLNQVSELMN